MLTRGLCPPRIIPESNPYNLENLPFHRAKTAVQCIFAAQLTGPKTI